LSIKVTGLYFGKPEVQLFLVWTFSYLFVIELCVRDDKYGWGVVEKSTHHSVVRWVLNSFDFSTLYTTLPHDKLKTRLKEIIHKAFSHRNYGSKFFVLGYNSTYFYLELLIDKTSSIYLYVKLKALASWIFLSFTSFWRNADSYEYKNKSARRGAQFVSIGMPTTFLKQCPSKNHKFSKYMQQYTSFSCIWCLHLAIDSLCKGQ
jgi:hypothetical protein